MVDSVVNQEIVILEEMVLQSERRGGGWAERQTDRQRSEWLQCTDGEYEWNWKIEKEIEDLKLIIESKNNQVESKNKHIKRLERIISNMKKNNLIGRDSEQLCCSINFNKKIDRYVIESVPKSFLKPHVCGA